MLKHARPIALDDRMAQPRERIRADDSGNRRPGIERNESTSDPDTSGHGADIVQGSRSGMRVALEIMKPKLREGWALRHLGALSGRVGHCVRETSINCDRSSKIESQLVADGWISPAQDGRRPEPFFGTNISDSGSFLVTWLH